MRRGAALLLILLGTLWGAGGATAQAPPTVPHFFFGTETEVTLDGVTYTEGPVLLVATTPAGDSLAQVQVDLPVRQWSLNVPVGARETEILFELKNVLDRDTVLGTTEPFAIEAGGLTEVPTLAFVSGPRFRAFTAVQGVAGSGQLLDAPPIPTDEQIEDREAGMGEVSPDDTTRNKLATPVLPPAVRATMANEAPAVLTDGVICGDRLVEIHDGWNAIGWTGSGTSLAGALTRVTFDQSSQTPIILSPGLLTAQAAASSYDGLAFRWNADSQGFGRNDVRLPDSLQGFTQVGRMEALWTRFSSPGDAQGWWAIPIASPEASTIALAPGWNFAVWTGPLILPETAFADLEAHDVLSQAFTWDAAGQNYLRYEVGAPDFLQSMTALAYGDPVWLHAKTAYNWSMLSGYPSCGDGALLLDFGPGDEAISMGLPPIELQTAAAGDFQTFRNTKVTTQGDGWAASPTASNDRNAILYVGHYHADLSFDSGETWQYIDPYANGFPAWPAGGGFSAMDQLTVFDDETGRTFWALQGKKDDNSESTIRLVVYENKAALETQTYCVYDFTPQTFGVAWSNPTEIDIRQMQVTYKWLYLSANLHDHYNTPTDGEQGGIIWRLEKAAFGPTGPTIVPWGGTLCGEVGGDYYINDDYRGGAALTDQTSDTGSTIYWAVHDGTGNDSLEIGRATDESIVIDVFTRAISAFPASNPGDSVCTAPDGTNPCGQFNARITTGWLSNGQVGFMWHAAQDADAGWPMPHTRVAIFQTSDLSLVAEPHIWNQSAAWVLPTVGVNNRGDIAGPIYLMGGGYYPTAQAFIWDSYSGVPAPWEIHGLRQGGASAGYDVFGHRGNGGRTDKAGGSFAYDSCRNTWLVSFYTMHPVTLPGTNLGWSADAEHRFAWIGREEDGCADLIVESIEGLIYKSDTIISVGETTRNIGSGPASASVTRWYLSTNQTKGPDDILLTRTWPPPPPPEFIWPPQSGEHVVPPLDAGESHSDIQLLYVPTKLEGVAIGKDYYLIACADDPSTVTEITQTNNCTASYWPVGVLSGGSVGEGWGYYAGEWAGCMDLPFDSYDPLSVDQCFWQQLGFKPEDLPDD